MLDVHVCWRTLVFGGNILKGFFKDETQNTEQNPGIEINHYMHFQFDQQPRVVGLGSCLLAEAKCMESSLYQETQADNQSEPMIFASDQSVKNFIPERPNPKMQLQSEIEQPNVRSCLICDFPILSHFSHLVIPSHWRETCKTCQRPTNTLRLGGWVRIPQTPNDLPAFGSPGKCHKGPWLL